MKLPPGHALRRGRSANGFLRNVLPLVRRASRIIGATPRRRPLEATLFPRGLAFRKLEIDVLIHAAEHLAAAAAACFPDPTVATAWLDARKRDLLTLGPLPVLDAFDRLKPPTPKAAETRRVERAYFASRVDRMDYPSLRLDGLPIGSGAIESSADHVVQRRMKRAGMRWSEAGGDAMLALRARQRSRRSLAA